MAVPLVLIHAFPLDHRLFDQLGELPGQLLTPDLPGFGGTAISSAAPSLDVFADHVIAAMDEANVTAAVVGGVSMGGYVALNLLARYPDRLLGLVLADTKVVADPEAARENRLTMAAAADTDDHPAPAALIAPLISDSTRRDNPDVTAYLEKIVGDQPGTVIAWAQRAMAGRPDRTAELAATQLPVLVIVGEKDGVTGPEFAHQMADLAAQSRLVILPDVGHLTPQEDPVGFTSELADWLSDTFPD